LQTVSGANTWAGPISLDSNAAIGADGVSKLTITGVISGVAASGLTKLGTGTVVFNGATSNTYQGATTVNAGVLQLNMTNAGAFAIPGDLIIGDGVNPSSADTDVVQLLADGQFNTAGNITINSTGLLDLNGHNPTVG